jgi:MFS transporter, ACS family, tartrate transporter
MLPPAVAMCGQLFMGWGSDHFKERRWHAVLPIVMGSTVLGLMPHTQGNLMLTMICLMGLAISAAFSVPTCLAQWKR